MENESKSSGSKFFFELMTFLLILLFATMPFHYVLITDHFTVFTKDHFTFRRTFITESVVNELINEYNESGLLGKSNMDHDPLIRKLMQEGIIYQK